MINFLSIFPYSGVLFPANWFHYGMEPNHFCENLRTTIAFNYSSLQSFETMKQKKSVKKFL